MGCKQSPIAAMLTAWTDKVGGVSRRLTHSLTQSTGTRACTIHSLLNSLRLSHSVRHTTFWSPPRVQVLRTTRKWSVYSPQLFAAAAAAEEQERAHRLRAARHRLHAWAMCR